MLEWPEHEKECEIQRLRASLAARDREQATRDVLCNSLADEAEQLRGQLGATVRVCEELLGRLERQKNLATIGEHKTQVTEVCMKGVWARFNSNVYFFYFKVVILIILFTKL